MYFYCCQSCNQGWFSSRPSKRCPFCGEKRAFVSAEAPDDVPELSRNICKDCQGRTECIVGMSLDYCSVCGADYAEEEEDMDTSDTTTTTTIPTPVLSRSFKKFRPPTRVATSTRTVSISGPKKVQPTRQARIERQTTYTSYQCKVFTCGLYWASDDKHPSCRCPYCGGKLLEITTSKQKTKGLPEQSCTVCNCLIRFDAENAKVKFCPHDYCGQVGSDDDEEQSSLTSNAQQIVASILLTVKARKRKYLVNEHLISESRIDFREAFKQGMPSHKDSSGNWLHRRHVIPQHLLREAWNEAVIRNKPDKKALLKLGAMLGLSGDFKNEQLLASAILYTINENPNNLFLAEGTPNSAIGALAHSLLDLAEKYGKVTPTRSNLMGLLAEFEKIRSPPKWGAAVGKMVKSIIQTYLPLLTDATSLPEAINLVEDLADTANLDLDTTAQGLGRQNGKAIALYQKFQQWVQNKGNWDAFILLLQEFMNTNMVT
ncbi:hypothetical protein MYSTI_01977 [Myxococcus stipitatus DSM 14675]|uniref:Uncharacterized protein n=1 Tax=Myxococcus stipitatus (strain DSM 14675 / JCM 12634 / Mx s8) TaxID=1278073 RepID=L7U3E9_MYXSD|nr:hypothetical protein MYSTI_01977 [Myxococcus stipitatus DSM 14675]